MHVRSAHRAVKMSIAVRAVVVVLTAALSVATAVSCAKPMPSNDQVLQAVQQSQPAYFDSSGRSKIHIVKVVEPQPGWYVASVKVDGAGETGKVILRQQDPPNGPLTVVAGPGTSFPPQYVSVPDAVRKAL
jgi:hypothetical protein